MRPVLLLHLFHADVAIELIDRVARLDPALDVVATVPPGAPPAIAAALGTLPHRTEIVETPNVGWDIAPLFAMLPRLRERGYDLVCKLHTKKGGSGYAGEWRDLFYESLIADDALIARITALFESEARLDLLGPAALYKSAAQHQFLNGDRLARLVPALAAPHLPPSDWGFFAGTMFWARLDMLERLAPFATFDEQADGASDGALAHAIERLFGLAPFAADHLIRLVTPARDAEAEIALVAAPGAPSHEPIVTTLVAKAEETAGEMAPHLAALIARENPLVDYLRHGREADALDPNPYFSSTWYNRINADVAAAGMHPLVHYARHGAFEDRSTGPLFDMGFYMAGNPEIARDRLDPLRHYLEIGLPAGQLAIPVSDRQSDGDEGEGPRRFYRRFDLDRERTFLRGLEALPEDVRQAARATRFSIVMPAWNRAATIAPAIRSVIDQTHVAWELLIVDDGSTDDTHEVVAPYLDDPRIRLIAADHGGVSAARNLGLAAATGDFVAYLDSDNRWKPTFLETMALFMTAGEHDVAYAALELRDDLGQLAGYHGDDFDWAACLQQNYVDLNSFCHSRALFGTLGGFDPALRRMVDWDLILRYGRDRAVGYAPFVGCDYHDGKADAARITRAEPLAFRKLVQRKHDAGLAARPLALAFAIKIAAPEAEKELWGDYHFATSLAAAIERLGHVTHIDLRDRWHVRPPAEEDVVIVLRGLISYEPQPGPIHLLWAISHPDQLGYDEADRFAHVYTASRSAAEFLSHIVRPPVSALLQATDATRFHAVADPPPAPALLFCGNSRGVDRPVIDWAIASGHPPTIIGSGWEGREAAAHVAAPSIDNAALGPLYAGAGAVLNDHWPSMRTFGFVSNRLFDVVAAGGRAISDSVPSIAPLFGAAVRQVSGPASMAAAIAALADGPPDPAIAAQVQAEHSFDARVRTILGDVEAMLGLAPASPATPTMPAGPKRLRVHAIVPMGPFGPPSSAFLRLVAPLTDESVSHRIAFTMAGADAPLPPADIVIVQRTAIPTIAAADALLLAIGRAGATLVTDCDDAFALMGEGHPEAAAYAPRSAALDRLIAAAAENWWSTPQLRAAYAGLAHRGAIIANHLDPRIWRDFRAAPRAILEGPVVRMLYMGTHTHAADFALIRPALDRLAESHAGRFELTVIGITHAPEPAPWLRVLAPPAGTVPYPRFVRWLRGQGPFDVGLAPLADTAFNRCKSDLKLLDYAALGLLPVASEIAAYRDDPAIAARTRLVGDGDWHSALAALIEDPADAADRAQALGAHLWEHRSVAAMAERMAARLEALAGC